MPSNIVKLRSRDQPGKRFTRPHLNESLGTVAHTWHPNCEGRLKSRGLWFHTNPSKKVLGTPISIEKSWVWWCTPVIPAMVGNVK
jgi:hypothetical protein